MFYLLLYHVCHFSSLSCSCLLLYPWTYLIVVLKSLSPNSFISVIFGSFILMNFYPGFLDKFSCLLASRGIFMICWTLRIFYALECWILKFTLTSIWLSLALLLAHHIDLFKACCWGLLRWVHSTLYPGANLVVRPTCVAHLRTLQHKCSSRGLARIEQSPLLQEIFELLGPVLSGVSFTGLWLLKELMTF